MALEWVIRDVAPPAEYRGKPLPASTVYVEVDFYASRAARMKDAEPLCVEDFLMSIEPVVTRLVVNEDGWPRVVGGEFEFPFEQDKAGEWVPKDREWERETVALSDAEIAAIVDGNIARHAALIESRPDLRGDRRLLERPPVREVDTSQVAERLASRVTERVTPRPRPTPEEREAVLREAKAGRAERVP